MRHVTRAFRYGVLAGALAVAAACGEDTPTAPTPIEPVIVTDTFSGTINRNGAATHSFSTASSGQVTATLTSLTPDDTLVVGLLLGVWNATTLTCNVSVARDQAVKATVIFATVNAIGDLCVRIYDVGQIGTTTDYEITVTHP